MSLTTVLRFGCSRFVAGAMLMIVLAHPVAKADIVTGGSMTHNLNSAALRDPSSADGAYLALFGVVVDPAQPLLIFGNHFNSSETVGKDVTQFRPQPIDPLLPRITAVPLPRVNYRDDPAAIEASITAYGSTSALQFGVNGPNVTPSGLPGRAEQSSTFTFDPSNVASTASGAIGLDGVTSLWFANTPVIDTGSVWLAYGDLSLSFDAVRATGGNSGWFLTNHLLFDSPVYDIRNVVFSNIIAATPSTLGSFTMSGDLFTSTEFRDGFGIVAGLGVGSFELNAITAVPEASTMLLCSVAGVLALGLRARRPRHS